MTGFDAALGLIFLAAIIGSGRASLFFVNRLVFGKKHERPLFRYLAMTVAAVIAVLPIVAALAFRAIENEEWSPLSKAAGIILGFLALTGVYWIVHRVFVNRNRATVAGTRSRSAIVTQLRRAISKRPGRRRFLGAVNDVYDLEVTEHDIIVSDLPPALDGLTIGFMSDTHVASFLRKEFFVASARALSEREPDLILLGGDYVSWNRHIPLLGDHLLTHLKAKRGVFAVLGNHDVWSGTEDVVNALVQHGVTMITNERVTLEHNGGTFDVLGIDELYRGEPELGLLNGTRERLTILLSHHPDLIGEISDQRFDLFLCGHTHGGQIRLPGIGAVVVPSKFETKYDQGFFRVRNTLLYVGRGLGSVPPIRILCKPEVAIFRFTTK